MKKSHNIDCPIPKPFLFNCWKHHKHFIQNEINKLVKTDSIAAIELLKKQLLIIGESQTDLYVGDLTPVQIVTSITAYLKTSNIFEPDKYKKWILENDIDYKIITIEDESCWTLRIGEQEDQYIHIHPCRNSMHSIRVRSLNLKTAIAVIVWTRLNGLKEIELSTVNYVRKEFLAECPVKSLDISKGLNKIIQLFN